MKDPEKTIGQLDELRGLINQRVSHLCWEIETIQEQWAGLSRVGGQRADHAASLLGSLRPHLDDLSKFSAARLPAPKGASRMQPLGRPSSKARGGSKGPPLAFLLRAASAADKLPSMSSTAENFARNLRAVIEATGQSQRQFADKAGTSHVYVNRVLRGKIKPTLTMADRLAAAAGLRVIDLLGAQKKSKDAIDGPKGSR